LCRSADALGDYPTRPRRRPAVSFRILAFTVHARERLVAGEQAGVAARQVERERVGERQPVKGSKSVVSSTGKVPGSFSKEIAFHASSLADAVPGEPLG
jgi:hypothetical protein